MEKRTTKEKNLLLSHLRGVESGNGPISDGLERHFKETPKDVLEREWNEISQ